MNSNKTTGQEGVPAESYKALKLNTLQEFQDIMEDICSTQRGCLTISPMWSLSLSIKIREANEIAETTEVSHCYTNTKNQKPLLTIPRRKGQKKVSEVKAKHLENNISICLACFL